MHKFVFVLLTYRKLHTLSNATKTGTLIDLERCYCVIMLNMLTFKANYVKLTEGRAILYATNM